MACGAKIVRVGVGSAMLISRLEVQAWASATSFRPKGGGPKGGGPKGGGGDLRRRGVTRSGAFTARSARPLTAPPIRMRVSTGNGRERRRCDMGHARMENRNGWVVAGGLNWAPRDGGTRGGAAASASRRGSAGSRRAPGQDQVHGRGSGAPGRGPPTPSSDCPGCWRSRHDDARPDHLAPVTAPDNNPQRRVQNLKTAAKTAATQVKKNTLVRLSAAR